MERVRILDPAVDESAVRLMHARAVELIPAIGERTITAKWAGYIDSTPDGVPAIGIALASMHHSGTDVAGVASVGRLPHAAEQQCDCPTRVAEPRHVRPRKRRTRSRQVGRRSLRRCQLRTTAFGRSRAGSMTVGGEESTRA